MSEKKNYHVVPHENGWAVQREGAQRPSVVKDTKADALTRGRELAKKSQGELIPHRRDGVIQNPNSYGNDPHPPKDRKH